ncbi:Hypothetical protein SMAX5B_021649, partial [Scophthalmus maximus]
MGMGNQWEPCAHQQDISTEEISVHTPRLETLGKHKVSPEVVCASIANQVEIF